MRKILFIVFIFIGFIAKAQDVTFTVSAPTVVEKGERFKLTYTTNKEGTSLRLPALTGFEVLMGPQTSTMTSISNVNGRMTQSASYTYTYLIEGAEEGVFQIPPATIVIDGKEHKSNTINIEVVKGSPSSATGNTPAQSSSSRSSLNEENLFVRIEVSKRSLYMGESLVATIKIYVRDVALSRFGQNTSFPSFDGFLAEEIATPTNVDLSRRETYNGKVYNVGIIRKMLLFPQHTGEITIDPFELECIVRETSSTGSRSIFDDFFNNYSERSVRRRSSPVKITVKDLPAGKPVGYGGTVGRISMNTTISADTINANDAITYKVNFNGVGNLKLMEAPVINFPHDFETYEPKVTQDIRMGENGMSGNVTFEYLLIPRYSGDYTIPAVQYSYFDTQTNTYKTLQGEEYKINVQRGNERSQEAGNAAVQSFKKEDVRLLGEDIRFIKTGDLRLHAQGVNFFGKLSYWLWFIIPFVVFVAGVIVNRRRIQANADIVRVKNRTANKMAIKRMKVAAQAMRNQNTDLFYDEVLKALWGYMSYKLNIDMAALNRDNISGILKEKNVDEGLIQEFINLLDHCEFARYAPGGTATQEMDRVYKEGIEVITRLDKAIK
ncbi:MAG: BatD family protein [Odoribacter sp.]|nr:BatD family protein [Odoribacter sp.]